MSPRWTSQRVTVALSVIVPVAVAVTLGLGPRRIAAPAGGPDVLATVNAGLNAAATACLIAGFLLVRAGRLVAHRRAMLGAFGFSSLFLVTYLAHHVRVGSVAYAGTGALRVIYFSLLVPHVLLAMAVVPLALVTLSRGLADQRPAHRRLARVTLPIWLYVSASGVVLYFLLYRP